MKFVDLRKNLHTKIRKKFGGLAIPVGLIAVFFLRNGIFLGKEVESNKT